MMNMQFWGTAAAEGVPALFCDCETCRESRLRKGRNVRTRTQSLIDDTLLVDMGPDTLLHEMKYGLDFTHIEHCLITHIHEDHFDFHTIQMRQRGFANLAPETKPLNLWGSEELGCTLKANEQGKVNCDDSVFFRPLAPFTPTVVGVHEVTALPARHGTKQPYNYIIRNIEQNKTLLYAHDTGLWQEDDAIWSYLQTNHVFFDLVSMDCTMGNQPAPTYQYHMSLSQNLQMREQLCRIGAANDATVFISNHFSHNGVQALYDTMIDPSISRGLLIAYDGMKVDF